MFKTQAFSEAPQKQKQVQGANKYSKQQTMNYSEEEEDHRELPKTPRSQDEHQVSMLNKLFILSKQNLAD